MKCMQLLLGALIFYNSGEQILDFDKENIANGVLRDLEEIGHYGFQ